MWKNLTPADLEQAKLHLKHRREEMLSRQAEERRGLEVEHSGVEALDRLVDDFAQKFKTGVKPPESSAATPPPEPVAMSTHEPIAAPTPEPAVMVKKEPSDTATRDDGNRGKPVARPRHPQKRTYAESNFETFSRAVSRTI